MTKTTKIISTIFLSATLIAVAFTSQATLLTGDPLIPAFAHDGPGGSHTGQTMFPAGNIDPDELNLNSKGKWVTFYATFGQQVATQSSCDLRNTITMSPGRLTAVQTKPPTCESSISEDGLTQTIKFSRAKLIEQVERFGVGDGGFFCVTVSGALNFGNFDFWISSDCFSVIDKKGK